MIPFALLPSLALAETYTVDFEIVGGAPTGAGATDVVGQELLFEGVADGHPDQSLSSSWSYIVCLVDDGDVKVRFIGPVSDWPTSWPATATCSAEGYTLVLNLVESQLPYMFDTRAIVPSLGIVLDLSPVNGNPRGKYKVFDLPPGPSYNAGSWLARLSPQQEWPGVQCTMAFAPNGNPTLQLFVHPQAAEGDGYCILESASGVPHALGLEILR